MERLGFVGCARWLEGHDEETEGHRVIGEPVAAVAFIPAGTDGEVAALGVNATPPASFDDTDDFMGQLAQRDYRGALAIVDPVLHLDDNHAVIGASCNILRAPIGAGYVHGPHGIRHNVGAPTDKRRVDFRLEPEIASITHWQRFLLHNPTDAFGRHERDALEPYGWIRITYRLWNDGRARAELAASFAPSCWFYRDYQRIHRYDMRRASQPDIDDVLRPRADVASGTTWTATQTAFGCVHRMT